MNQEEVYSGKYQILQVPGFPGYLVDTEGMVYTTHKRGRKSEPFSRPPVPKSQWTNKNGYKEVQLLDRDKVRRNVLVHRIVLLTFVGKPPKDERGFPYDGCHGIGGKSDNRLINLSWKTRQENMSEDKIRDRTLLHGGQLPWAKINETQADVIRYLLNHSPMSEREIAKIMKISRGVVVAIKRGRTWQ